jgi:hypothetical protein
MNEQYQEIQPLLLKRCELDMCEAACCYDGVYLDEEDQEKLRATVQTYADYFFFLPADYIVKGTWQHKEERYKTAVRPHQYKNKNYPEHFAQTRCVFCLNNARCSLQELSVALGEHPWSRKPKPCWMQPLHPDASSRLVPPPVDPAKDPDRNENYPGFVCYTPCGAHCADGKPWREVLAEEVKYYDEFANKR